MVKKLEIYRCSVCANVVEVLTPKDGTLVCCGQNMNLLIANSVDASKDTHIPVVEKLNNNYHVKVGKESHPMKEDHFIEWIAIFADDKLHRKFLKPGDEAKALFSIDGEYKYAIAYCNKHMLWKN